jgi:hypothetical protein
MHDDARARRTKMAPADNPLLQRPGWVRGTREARLPVGRIATPRAFSQSRSSRCWFTSPKSPANSTQFRAFLIDSDFE